jgi:ornithine carbamoyltransferase
MTSATTTIDWPTDLLGIGDLTCIALAELVAMAAQMKSEPDGWSRALRGETLACVLNGPSVRTRLSTEAAAHRLGMVPVALRPDDLRLGDRDAAFDVARTLSRYASAVVTRKVANRELAAFARAATIPVVNVHSPGHHPGQALADMLTLREHFGQLEGLVLAYVGPSADITRSLMDGGALAGMHIRLACPPDFRPRDEDRFGAEILADRHDGSVTLAADPHEAATGAHAVYAAPWPEATRARNEEAQIGAYQVDGPVMRCARPDAVFMHCLPAHRGEEVTAAVFESRQSVVWEQAANRLPAEEAVLYALVTAHGARAA